MSASGDMCPICFTTGPCICAEAIGYIEDGNQLHSTVRVHDESLPRGVHRYGCKWLFYSETGESLSYFVFLMTNVHKSGKKHTFIGTARNPAAAVIAYNEGRLRSRKNTKQGSPHWRLEQWIGPFDTKGEAERFRHQWDDGTRGVRPRIKRGQQLAKEWELSWWSMRARGNGSMVPMPRPP